MFAVVFQITSKKSGGSGENKCKFKKISLFSFPEE